MIKFSRQRESIRRNLMMRKDHPTADMIFADIRKEYPNISLGTVYRNLSLLSDMGEIRKLNVQGGADRFDGNLAPHQHFICCKCGRIQDLVLYTEDSDRMIQDVKQQIGATVSEYSITFTGICADCASRPCS